MLKYFAFLALLVAPSFAAIAIGGSAGLGNNAGSGNYTVAFSNSGSNVRLFLGCEGDTATDSISGATYAGVSMTLVAKAVGTGSGSPNRSSYVWELDNPTTGSNNFVVSNGGGATYIICSAIYLTGVNLTGTWDAKNSAGSLANTSSLTTSITTVANNAWVIEFAFNSGSTGQLLASTGATFEVDETFHAVAVFASSVGTVTPAGSYSMTVTTSGMTLLAGIYGIQVSAAPFTGSTAHTAIPVIE